MQISRRNQIEALSKTLFLNLDFMGVGCWGETEKAFSEQDCDPCYNTFKASSRAIAT
jgi:hypothetical protein